MDEAKEKKKNAGWKKPHKLSGCDFPLIHLCGWFLNQPRKQPKRDLLSRGLWSIGVFRIFEVTVVRNCTWPACLSCEGYRGKKGKSNRMLFGCLAQLASREARVVDGRDE